MRGFLRSPYRASMVLLLQSGIVTFWFASENQELGRRGGFRTVAKLGHQPGEIRPLGPPAAACHVVCPVVGHRNNHRVHIVLSDALGQGGHVPNAGRNDQGPSRTWVRIDCQHPRLLHAQRILGVPRDVPSLLRDCRMEPRAPKTVARNFFQYGLGGYCPCVPSAATPC